jgi:hypothetical protein
MATLCGPMLQLIRRAATPPTLFLGPGVAMPLEPQTRAVEDMMALLVTLVAQSLL